MTTQFNFWAYTQTSPHRITEILVPRMFTASLFTISKNWNQPPCSSAGEWIMEIYINTNQHYSKIGCKTAGRMNGFRMYNIECSPSYVKSSHNICLCVNKCTCGCSIT